jgi:hypothetical protein
MLPMMLFFLAGTLILTTHTPYFGKPLIFPFFLAGTLILTTHVLYFQSIRVGYGDKIVKYDLAIDSNQVIKRDFTGPLGVRLFDKAVMYQSSTL